MRAVIQRVTRASVTVDGTVIGAIREGVVLLIGVARGDTEQDADYVAEKCAYLRIFGDAEGKMNHSVLDVGGGVLAISQFTLYGDTRKGRRPGFDQAAPPDMAQPLYERVVTQLRALGLSVETGRFGAMMRVDLCNDGPVTFIVDSPCPR